MDKIISSGDIVVFVSTGCPYCAQALSSLRESGHHPVVVEATREQRAELQSRTSSSSVPSVWVKGKYVGGTNDGPEPWMGIRKLIANGELSKMLA